MALHCIIQYNIVLSYSSLLAWVVPCGKLSIRPVEVISFSPLFTLSLSISFSPSLPHPSLAHSPTYLSLSLSLPPAAVHTTARAAPR